MISLKNTKRVYSFNSKYRPIQGKTGTLTLDIRSAEEGRMVSIRPWLNPQQGGNTYIGHHLKSIMDRKVVFRPSPTSMARWEHRHWTSGVLERVRCCMYSGRGRL